MGTNVIGYGNVVEDVVAPSPFGCAVVHANSEIVFGFVTTSSSIRVSLHQNLEERRDIIKPTVFRIDGTGCLPERGLTIPYILTLPLDHIQDMQNPVLDPILIKDTIQDCILRKNRGKGRHQVFPHQSGP